MVCLQNKTFREITVYINLPNKKLKIKICDLISNYVSWTQCGPGLHFFKRWKLNRVKSCMMIKSHSVNNLKRWLCNDSIIFPWIKMKSFENDSDKKYWMTFWEDHFWISTMTFICRKLISEFYFFKSLKWRKWDFIFTDLIDRQ